MKTVMRSIYTLCSTLIIAAPAYAAANPAEEVGMMGWLFLGFAALIGVFQLIPAIMLFATMVKGVAAPAMRKVENR